VSALHDAGIKVMTDLVPNHTSDRHAWFVEARAAGRGSAARERYHFRDGTGSDGSHPPNDWASLFGGSAWQRVEDGQWYLHVFAPEQPDLNWDHPEVRNEFRDILRFWCDRGVDGFRVDVAHGLAKDLSEPWLRQHEMWPPDRFPSGTHPWWDREEVHDIYTEWRTVFDAYDPPRMGVAECFAPPESRGRYAEASGLGQVFDFELLEAPFAAEPFRQAVDEGLTRAAASGSANAWVLSNHDVVRHATRYGLPGGTPETAAAWLLSEGRDPALDVELGLRRARAAALFMLALPGAAYLYQGEELGLREVADLPLEALQDPAWVRSGHQVKGRDGCRVPLPWNRTGTSFGFGRNGSHLPQPDWFAGVAVEVQDSDPGSMLSLYRAALTLRRTLQSAPAFEWLPAQADLLHFRRPGGWHCLTWFGDSELKLADTRLPARSELLLSSDAVIPGDLLPPVSSSWWHAPDDQRTS
jgi:alpha-glucosidase